MVLQKKKKSFSGFKIQNFVYGLDSQISSLEKYLLNFKAKKNGGSCLLSGRTNTGKTLVLESLIQKHFSDDDCDINIRRVDGLSKMTKLFEKLDLEGPVLIVVDHFELFAYKQQQNFLYSILNGSQTLPWFVVLIGTTENSVNLLEKRVKSRFSALRVNFNVTFSLEQFDEGFGQLLDCSSLSKKMIKKTKEDDNCKKLLCALHCRYNCFGYLKKIVVLFERVCLKYEQRKLEPSFLFELCVESVLPTKNQQQILSSLSLRQLCLLNCLVKLESSEYKQRIDFTYQEIAKGYIKFTNDYEKSMRVCSFVLYRDLDELAASGALSLAKGSDFGQIQFKKATSNVELDAIIKTIGRGKIPTKVENWILSPEL